LLMANMKNGRQQSSQEEHAFITSFKQFSLGAWRYTFYYLLDRSCCRGDVMSTSLSIRHVV
jgi:hypothetical protein